MEGILTFECSVAHPRIADIEKAVREALGPTPGPWTVTIRAADTPHSSPDWSVVVSRPGHVWLMRASPELQEPPLLSEFIRRSVRPGQFHPSHDGS